ncbi:MAG: hypothetical protein A2277_21295 [Desulfobacterales bacterium RIFOXYA12_FULL_46_15]|nr:MAG: hypothetical protein A2097_14240 [Desulfobacula sp. GWF2_41_7]OGR25856.1 MAG: hypothetical protein A2277_21295 [Desulfobacterales bacterium RIFOXYA12_FULL_46_15]
MTDNKINIVLVGFDLEIIDLIESSPHYKLHGYIDFKDVSKQFGCNDINYLGNDETWMKNRPDKDLTFAFGMNSPQIRKDLFLRYRSENIGIIKSASCYIARKATIEIGTVIQHHVTIMPMAKIGKGCLLNINSTVHHESDIGDFSILAPGAMVLGRVNIGERVYIGAGAIIKENCCVGPGSVIGAGSVVIRDIPDNSTMVGVPAKKVIKDVVK